MAQYRISRKSFTISRVGILWVVSIIWLINITPLMGGIQITSTPSDNAHIADNKDTHTPNMLIAPLNEKDLLLRGINMPWYTNTQRAKMTLSNGSEVYEDITPYWLKIGFNRDVLRADLDAMALMGVRHIRTTALIFQFLNWHPEFGRMGINESVRSNFDTFVEEVQSRGMILTVSLFAPLWNYSDHPSLMKYFRIFNATSGYNSSALDNLQANIVLLAQRYRQNDAIHTWEVVSGFSLFTECLKNQETGFGLDVDATTLFDFFEETAASIREVANGKYATISDGWPLQYNETWWNTGLVPMHYDERLQQATDYIALYHMSDNTTLRRANTLVKHEVLVQVGSTQLYNYSRQTNSRVLLDLYLEALNKSYSGFCPWAFSQNIVFNEENNTSPDSQKLDWSWDALLLFSLYRNNSIKFINTTNWYVLSTEPQIDAYGRLSFTLFHRPEAAYPAPYGFTDGRNFDPSQGGTVVTVYSENLLFGNMLITNREYPSDTLLFGSNKLGPCNYVTTISTISDVGYVKETGIQIHSNNTWNAIVDEYEPRKMALHINSTGPIECDVRNGGFIVSEGNDYTVSFTDLVSGKTWQKAIEADDNQSLSFVVNASSVVIRIFPSPDVAGMISLGLSVSAIVISIVIYYAADRVFSKKTEMKT